MNSGDDLLEKIQKAKQDYYSENQKNVFFKNKQKIECASQVVQQIDMNLVFEQIISIQENRIIFNYPLFKLVANPSIYLSLANRTFLITGQILKTYSSYNVIVNLQGITMSAIERYKDFVLVISKEGLKNGNNFLKSLGHIFIENPPSIAEAGYKIIQPFLDPIITERIIIMPKTNINTAEHI
jgi:hypothetical protein